MKNGMLVLLGATIGGLLGYFLFFWIARQGFYALILPGGLVGMGAAVFKNKSTAISVVCGVLALAFGLVTEWRFEPFAKDATLVYFLAHVYELRPITLTLIAVGTLLGFWVPLRRRPDAT